MPRLPLSLEWILSNVSLPLDLTNRPRMKILERPRRARLRSGLVTRIPRKTFVSTRALGKSALNACSLAIDSRSSRLKYKAHEK